MRILVTGAAGFIGSALSHKLLDAGCEVDCIDNLNDYYDVNLKKARLNRLTDRKGFTFYQADIANREAVTEYFKSRKPQRVVHLAAQAGVRYSLTNPYAYIDANITGYLNILEGCRHYPVQHLIYASTSSVYGLSTDMPFSVHGDATHPVSLYAATKRANELFAHSYSHLFQIPTSGVRFFTVYGPWGRPDMALFLFTKNILAGKPIDVFNGGHHQRDFTYIDDLTEGLLRMATGTPPKANPAWNSEKADPSTSSAPYRIYNIGNTKTVELMRYIEVIEDCLGKKAEKNYLPLQAGDVPSTHADVSGLIQDFDYRPSTPIEVGIRNFVQWYREYYRV